MVVGGQQERKKKWGEPRSGKWTGKGKGMSVRIKNGGDGDRRNQNNGALEITITSSESFLGADRREWDPLQAGVGDVCSVTGKVKARSSAIS